MTLRFPFLALVATVVGVALITLICFRNPKKGPTWVADCPDHVIHIVDTVENQVITDIPIASQIDEVPEFHDCQRFVDSAPLPSGQRQGRSGYGPLVAIWVSQDLARLFPAPAGLTPIGSGGTVTSPPPQGSSTGMKEGLAYAVAQIYNFDAVPYDRLSIQPGMSCLYLVPTQQAQSGYTAMIQKLPGKTLTCSDPVPFRQLPNSWPLTVHLAERGNPTSKPKIPAVARWDFDYSSRSHYIGLGCGTEWCEIGGASFDNHPGEEAREVTAQVEALLATEPSLATVAADQVSRVTRVKGWYDEQNLAIRVASNNALIPSQVIGVAIPHPQLEELTADAFADAFTAKWVAAAYVGVSSAYDGKLSFAPGVTRVYLCAEGGAGCGIPAGRAPACDTSTQRSDDRWWAMHISAAGDTSYHCVMRHSHEGVIPAGAARWRWSEHDEKLWVRCTNGCCLVN